jgi:hypothetical protein
MYILGRLFRRGLMYGYLVPSHFWEAVVFQEESEGRVKDTGFHFGELEVGKPIDRYEIYSSGFCNAS